MEGEGLELVGVEIGLGLRVKRIERIEGLTLGVS
jgi:hypothetical protein